MTEARARRIVKERSGEDCELRLPGCLGRAETMHHRRKQSQRGPWTPSNLIHTCGDGTRGCHGVITNTRVAYYEEGWLVASWQDWGSKPVRLWHGLVLLDDAGGWTNLGESKHTAGCAVWTSNNPCDCNAEEAS
jgi:hypothetical protein